MKPEQAQEVAQQVADATPVSAEVAQQILEAAPFNWSSLWILLIAVALALMFMQWGKVFFYGRLKREKKRAVEDYILAQSEAAEYTLQGEKVPDGQAQALHELRQAADDLDVAFDHGIAKLYVWGIVVGIAAGLLTDWLAWDAAGLGLSALWGFFGGAASRVIFKWILEPVWAWLQDKFPWLRRKKKDDDDDDGPLPRGGNRKEFRTTTFAG